MVAQGEIKKSMFTSDDVYIFDTGISVICWVGKGSSPDERKNALSIALKYMADNSLPMTLPVCRVVEGGENPEFNALLSA